MFIVAGPRSPSDRRLQGEDLWEAIIGVLQSPAVERRLPDVGSGAGANVIAHRDDKASSSATLESRELKLDPSFDPTWWHLNLCLN
jgi:hypothetical protein